MRIKHLPKNTDRDYKLFMSDNLEPINLLDDLMQEIAWIRVRQHYNKALLLYVPLKKSDFVHDIAHEKNINLTPAKLDPIGINIEQRTEAYQNLYNRAIKEDVKSIYREISKGAIYVIENQAIINENISTILDKIGDIANQFNNEEQFYGLVKDEDLDNKCLAKICHELRVQKNRKY